METLLAVGFVVALVGLVVFAVLYFVSRRDSARLAGDKSLVEQRLDDSERRLSEMSARLQKTEMDEALARKDADALRARMEESNADREKMEEQLKAQFRNLANDIFGEQTRQFRETNKSELDLLLKPFRDNIKDFRERVEHIYSSENEQRGALRNELKNLKELNDRITTETANLTNALKGNSKVQGDWGEVILKTMLENSGLREGDNYEIQYNVKDRDNDRNLRPDVVLHLPGGKHVVIDSKVSLTAYERYSHGDESSSAAALREHVASVRRHVDELAAKDYQQYFADSPDFVIMFMPTEPSFLAALKEDASLWNYAYSKKVIISSPTNLFAVLKLVVDLWKRDAQDKNTARIVKTATDLYDQLCMFVSELEKVGSAIDNAAKAYGQAYKRMCQGNNNVIRLGERMRGMGLSSKKQQSSRALEEASISSADDENTDTAQLPE